MPNPKEQWAEFWNNTEIILISVNKYRVSRLHDYQENILEYHNLISVELNAPADEVKAQGTTNQV